MKTETSQTSPIRLVRIADVAASNGWLAITLASGKHTQGTDVRGDSFRRAC